MASVPAKQIARERENPLVEVFTAMRPPRMRTMREFAEAEIRMPPGGRYPLRRFSCKVMPWSVQLFEILTAAFQGRSPYRRYFMTADVQDGKTTMGIVIPLMYALFELKENVIFGVPDVDLAQGKFDEDIKPMILHSSYANLLPTKGGGSRGGKTKMMQFGNGTRLRFMGAGGGDQQRSSFPARIIFMTEVDKMDKPGQVSREADPVTQLEARSDSFDERALVFGECTRSTEKGRINQEISVKGTDTKVYVPCPHCGEYVNPTREHFGGWDRGDDVVTAREKAFYLCDKCERPWTEADRLEAIKKPVLVSKDQTVTRDGVVHGEPPRTNTFGFQWNAMLSGLKSIGYIGEKEFEAERSDDANPKKALFQFTWALPYDDSITDLSNIDKNIILAKIGKRVRGVVPEGTEDRLTVFIDLHKFILYWSAFAWREDRQGYLVDYGSIPVPQGDKVSSLAILAGLRSFREDILKPGWRTKDGREVRHRLCLVDSGWKKDIAYEFVKESGQTHYIATKGLGSGRSQDSWKEPKKSKDKDKVLGHECFFTRQPGNVRLLNMNADYWKTQVHEGFIATGGTPGALMLFSAPERDFTEYARQIVSERRVEKYDPRKGMTLVWESMSHHNHWLDCAYGCMCAADLLGASTLPRAEEKRRRRYANEKKTGKKQIRTRY